MENAAVKGAITRDTLEALDSIRMREQVLAALPPDVVERLTRASPVDWVALDDHLALYSAALMVLGVSRAQKMWLETMIMTVKKGAFRRLVEGQVSVHGVDPRALAKNGPIGWSMFTRGCGRELVETSERAFVAIWEDLPPKMIASAAFCLAMKSKLQAFLFMCEVHGTVTMRRDEEARRLEIHGRW